MPRTPSALALACLALLLLAAPSSAAWLPPVTVTERGGSDLSVALAPTGHLAVAVDRGSAPSEVAGVAVRPPGGTFSFTPTTGPWRVTASADGTLTGAVLAPDRLEVATRPPAGAFGPLVTAAAPSVAAGARALAVSPGGTVAAFWASGTSAVRAAGGQVAVEPAPSSFTAAPRLVVADSGAAVVTSGIGTSFSLAVRAATGGWSTAELMPDVIQPSSTAAAVNDRGDVLAVWATTTAVRVAYRPAGGAFGAPRTVAGLAPHDNPELVATLGPDGTGVIARGGPAASGQELAVVPVAAGGVPGAPVVVSTGSALPVLANAVTDAQGTSWLAWLEGPFNDAVVKALQVADGELGTLALVSAADEHLLASLGARPAIAVDGRGNAAVAWPRPGDARLAEFDAPAPPPPPGDDPPDEGGDQGRGGGGTAPPEVRRGDPAGPRVLPGPVVRGLTLRRQGATRLRVSFTLDGAAKVTLALHRGLRGRRAGGVCARPTRANRRRAACTRWAPVGRASVRSGKAGVNRVTLTVGRLTPGRYRLAATPSGGAAARASLTVRR